MSWGCRSNPPCMRWRLKQQVVASVLEARGLNRRCQPGHVLPRAPCLFCCAGLPGAASLGLPVASPLLCVSVPLTGKLVVGFRATQVPGLLNLGTPAKTLFQRKFCPQVLGVGLTISDGTMQPTKEYGGVREGRVRVLQRMAG